MKNRKDERKPWSIKNPSPAARLMESLGAPTNYSSQASSFMQRIRGGKKIITKAVRRANAKRQRIARRIQRQE